MDITLPDGFELCLPGSNTSNNSLPEDTDIVDVDTPIPSTNVGYQLLLKMGWQGKGLGVNQQGRLEPVKVTLKEDKLGLGKLEAEQTVHTESTSRRKALESEKIAEENEEQKVLREEKAQQQEDLKKHIHEINSAFYCSLCDKQYTKISEYESHLSSYDHHHKKRFQEMKQSSKNPDDLQARKEKDRKREEKELKRMQEAAMAAAAKRSTNVSNNVTQPILESTSNGASSEMAKDLSSSTHKPISFGIGKKANEVSYSSIYSRCLDSTKDSF
ncbi:hypothetical protein K7432_008284 [Basidiobolus ranarum]|uniref:G-patch domain-containing protein n=1 Tax=Basidiobolus ranarum TaxID=34480 RepID=A0ABR2WS23_9FUNG